MGKKKQQKEAGNKKQQEEGATEKGQKGKQKEEKGKKTYSLQNAEGGVSGSVAGSLPKISIPHDLERDLLSVIQSMNQERKLNKEVSNRLTNKKLMDMYTSLSSAGFAHKQIEQAMDNTVLHGGDLIDALDWLCLNTPNDKLPANFSQALQKEEEKLRPQFDKTQQREPANLEELWKVPNQAGDKTAENGEKKEKAKEEKPTKQSLSYKEKILQYVEQSSDESEKEEDPNERYLELTALLLDAKTAAAELKKEGPQGSKDKQKKITKDIRQYIVEMDALETHPDFDQRLIQDHMEDQKQKPSPHSSPTRQASDTPPTSQPARAQQSHDQSHGKSSDQPANQSDDEDGGDLGLSLFQEAAAAEPMAEKVKEVVVKAPRDVRNFEYTRQQWTGKSPKQFLIDWVRKHLKASPPPKFGKAGSWGNTHKCWCKIDKKKEGGIFEVTPEILCGNVKEAEHLAATLALYHLCRGQPVYQLLPPPYRDVWLEWLDAEKKAKEEEKSKENKPRDQFLSKLMSKIQITDKGSKGQGSKVVADDEPAESWEDMDWDEQELDEPDEEVAEDTSKPTKPQVGRRARGALSPVALREVYVKHEGSALYQGLLKTRCELPVYQHREMILKKLADHNVILVAGETGSGKSTQVPHFILQSCLMTDPGQPCNIVCTEPRRISAISLAMRVSQEMGEQKLGDFDSLCGYQIRFESRCGPNTRLTYCTTGVLLRKLQTDPQLKNVSHILVDEVHERSVQSDFLLIILRQLLNTRRDLKVVLMSATLDADKFSRYFSHCPVINIPGRTFPVEVFHVEDVVEQTGYVLDDDSPFALRQSELVKEERASLAITQKGGNQAQVDVFWTKEELSTLDTTGLPPDQYTLKTRNTVTRMNMKRINVDLIVETLLYLETGEQFCGVEGAVLIFLPGLADITELYEILQSDRRFMDNNRYRVIALHSVLSSSDQAQAFTVPPPGIRKVVLATNIAETGITIPDVVFVIDAGKVKENRFMEASQMSALEEVFISRANAKQRQGRAGRVREGYCFRLYTKHMYENLKPYTVPELLRVPLEELCLHIMKCGFGRPEDFLSQSLDPPQPPVVSRAMALLHSIGACVGGEELSPLGHHLAALPVHVRVGKMLLYAAVFGCLEPVAVIAAAMTNKSPFVAPIGKQDLANAAKMSLATAASDHITLYKAYLGWKEARSKGRQTEMTYCQKNFLKRNTLLEMENVKLDLLRLIHSIGFTSANTPAPPPLSEVMKDGVLQISKHATQTKLDNKTISRVKAVLTAGLYPNVAKVSYEAPVDAAANPEQKICVAETQQGPAAVHPSSVNRTLQANGWLVFHEKVRSSRVYLRDCTLISAFPLLLFGGKIEVQHVEHILSVDERIRYRAYAKTGVIFKELRKLLDDLLARKLEEPKLDISDNPLVSLIEDLLLTEKSR